MLRTLEKERSVLLLEEEVLKMQVAEAQALHNLQNDQRVQAMITVKQPLYSDPEPAVARRNP